MYIAFLIVLLDMIGFGIMVPILAYFALQLGAGPGMATLCMALYVFGMFLSTPIWGRLSDRYGRKPILILSLAGAVAGYLLLGMASTVMMVAASRLFSGLMAGNLSVAQAYVTDITSVQDRAKAMGLLGAAIGLSFILGPAIGGYLAGDSFTEANLQLPALVSAGLSLCALLVVVFVMRESHGPNRKITAEPGTADPAPKVTSREQGARQFLHWLRQQTLLKLLLLGVLLYNLAAGFVESVFPIWADATNVAHGPKDLVPILFIAGLAMVIMQAGLIGPLSRRFGEQRLMVAGSGIFTIAVLLVTVAGSAASVFWVTAALVGQAVGAALVITSMQSLVSKTTARHNRGVVMGIYSSLGTLGRGIGTALTGSVFAGITVHAPYYFGASFMVLLMLLSLLIGGFLRRRSAAQQTLTTDEHEVSRVPA